MKCLVESVSFPLSTVSIRVHSSTRFGDYKMLYVKQVDRTQFLSSGRQFCQLLPDLIRPNQGALELFQRRKLLLGLLQECVRFTLFKEGNGLGEALPGL